MKNMILLALTLLCSPFVSRAQIAGCDSLSVVKGQVMVACSGEGMNDAILQLTTNASGTPGGMCNPVLGTLDDMGNYEGLMQLGSDFSITPSQNDNHSNGVNVWDLNLISQHILGLQPLSAPYSIIAADANRSGTVTTFDIVEARKIILGIYTTFPNNTSWRFVNSDFNFSNPFNPFLAAIPESVAINNFSPADSLLIDLLGIKVGDVDCSANPNGIAIVETDSVAALVTIPEMELVEGQEFEVMVKTDMQDFMMQFTLNFNELEMLEVVPGPFNTESNFGKFPQHLTYVGFGQEATGFSLKMRALTAGKLSEKLSLSDEITQSIAFRLNGQPYKLWLQVDSVSNTSLVPLDGNYPHIVSTTPNPFRDYTNITFYQPEAGPVQLRVYDMQGRLVHELAQDMPAGNSVLPLTAANWTSAGAYRFVLQANGRMLSGNLSKTR